MTYFSGNRQAARPWKATGMSLVLLCLFCFADAAAQQRNAGRPAVEPPHPESIPLWPAGAPGSENLRDQKEVVVENGTGRGAYLAVSNVHNPTITPFIPAADKATGTAVIVMPGGGHRFLAITHEGYSVGQWLAEQGVAAFVLKYRLQSGSSAESGARYDRTKESLADAQRAIRLIRSRATEWKIKPNAVGVMGFSAGGEVAALASMNYKDIMPDKGDQIESQSSKPDFQALIYPGRSNTIEPDANSPPAFLACAFDDRTDISEGLADVYLKFHKAGVNAELHIFSSGGHGFGLRPDAAPRPVTGWPTRFVEWLAERKFASQ